MKFSSYEAGLKENIKVIRKAMESGVILSRKEKFDYLFKKQYAIRVGILRKEKFLDRVFKKASDYDYRIALLYAEVFENVKEIVSEGYEYAKICYLFDDVVELAKSYSISKGKYSIDISDKNNKFIVKMFNGSEECAKFKIRNMDDMVMSYIACTSLLVGSGEVTKSSKEWFSDYLFLQYKMVTIGEKANAYFERNRVLVNLEDFLKSDASKNLVEKKNEKIVAFRAV